MAGFPVLGPLEHSVLMMTLDGGHSEMTIDGEPLAHSVPDVVLDGRPMEGIPVLEPLEHSVLVGALDSGLMEGMSHLEPLEHSVLNAARGDLYRKEASVFEPLEHSVLKMTLDDSPLERMSDELLEHSVLEHTYPAGQCAAVGPVGLFGTLSPSDCHPAGLAGPYVAGGPVGPDEEFQVLDPLEHSVPEHADPAGQHAVFQDVLEPLEHSILDIALDG